MINRFRTLSARLTTRWPRRPRALVVCAWFWLAAHAGCVSEKHRCLEAILGLEKDNEPTRLAMQRSVG